jgi:hypothetical protein
VAVCLRLIGRPHCGHVSALREIWRQQSGHGDRFVATFLFASIMGRCTLSPNLFILVLDNKIKIKNGKLRPFSVNAYEYINDLFRVGEERSDECFPWVKESFLQHKRTRFTPVTNTEDEILINEEFGFE